MHEQPVVRLANDIAAQFHHQPVPIAANAVAEHIRSFWDPRMRAQLLALDDTSRLSLRERAVAALTILQLESG
jgi:formate dehydrogenase subunit delta